jgi:hypothetical protein
MMMVKMEIVMKLEELKSGWRVFMGDLVVGLHENAPCPTGIA